MTTLSFPIWPAGGRSGFRSLREGEWVIRGLHRGDVRVRAEPFDAFELDLAILWAKIAAPPPRGSRGSEDGTEYHVDAK